MKITIVVPSLSGRGGIETCVVGLSEWLSRNGDEVRVLVFGYESIDLRWCQDIDHSLIASRGGYLRKIFDYAVGAYQNFRHFKPEIAIVLYGSSVVPALIARTLSLSRVKLLSWLHFDLSRVQNASFVRFLDGHLCINSKIAQDLVNQLHQSKKRISIVYNGTTLTNDIRTLPHDSLFTILYFGRTQFGKQKRTDDFLRACSTIKGDYRVIIIGTGEEDDNNQLRLLAKDLGIENRLSWLGWIERPWDFIEPVHLLVMTSEYEGFGLVLIEAMARGIPCISTNCPSGPSEIIQEGTNGWLVPVADPNTLGVLLNKIQFRKSMLPSPDIVKSSIIRFDINTIHNHIKKECERYIIET